MGKKKNESNVQGVGSFIVLGTDLDGEFGISDFYRTRNRALLGIAEHEGDSVREALQNGEYLGFEDLGEPTSRGTYYLLQVQEVVHPKSTLKLAVDIPGLDLKPKPKAKSRAKK